MLIPLTFFIFILLVKSYYITLYIYTIMYQGLSANDLEDLKEDIVVYMNMDVSAGSDNSSYWNDITTIANNEIRKIRSSDEC